MSHFCKLCELLGKEDKNASGDKDYENRDGFGEHVEIHRRQQLINFTNISTAGPSRKCSNGNKSNGKKKPEK